MNVRCAYLYKLGDSIPVDDSINSSIKDAESALSKFSLSKGIHVRSGQDLSVVRGIFGDKIADLIENDEIEKINDLIKNGKLTAKGGGGQSSVLNVTTDKVYHNNEWCVYEQSNEHRM